MVGVAGFEPTTSSSRTKRATKLRHTPVERRKSTGGGWSDQNGSDSRAGTRGPRPGRRRWAAASGNGGEGEQRRLGRAGEPHRGVRRGAQTGRDVEHRTATVDPAEPWVVASRPRSHGRAVPRQALGLRPGQVAVGDERAVPRDAELAAVGVPGEHRPAPSATMRRGRAGRARA